MENKYDIGMLDGRFQRLEDIVAKISEKIQTRNESNFPSMDLINEKILATNNLHEKDLDVIRRDLTSISDDFSALDEKCQEMRGEINQIKMAFDNFKSHLDEKHESKFNFINNFFWPLLVIIVAAVLGFCMNAILNVNSNPNNYYPSHHIEQAK